MKTPVASALDDLDLPLELLPDAVLLFALGCGKKWIDWVIWLGYFSEKLIEKKRILI